MKDELWEHMNSSHGLVLLESELADIKEICNKDNEILFRHACSNFTDSDDIINELWDMYLADGSGTIEDHNF